MKTDLKIKNQSLPKNSYSLENLKKLRADTNISYDLCKKALSECCDDIIKAKEILSKWGNQFAEKKAERITTQGAIFSYIHHNKKVGSMVTLLCETDFVAKNDKFEILGKEIAMQIASTDPTDIKALLSSEYIKDPAKKVSNLIEDFILQIGENIKIGEFVRYEL